MNKLIDIQQICKYFMTTGHIKGFLRALSGQHQLVIHVMMIKRFYTVIPTSFVALRCCMGFKDT